MDTKKQKKTSDREYYFFALRIVGDFGASIALPVVIFVILGQWLDGKYDKSPLFTVMGFALAALLSGKMIYRKAKKYGLLYQSLVNKGQDKKQDGNL